MHVSEANNTDNNEEPLYTASEYLKVHEPGAYLFLSNPEKVDREDGFLASVQAAHRDEPLPSTREPYRLPQRLWEAFYV